MREPGRRFPFWKLRKRRVRYVALLPTLLTLGNGVCGFLALTETALGLIDVSTGATNPGKHFHWAGYLILIAMVFDALDGKVARMTRTASNFGAQMDSLCDLVTFGIAPAFLIYALNCEAPNRVTLVLPERVLTVICVFYAMCALVRLARFTVETTPDDESHQHFSGLPSPAAAGVIASAVIPWQPDFAHWPVMSMIVAVVAKALPFVAFFLGILMVSRIRYVHVVNRVFRGLSPFVRLIEIAIIVILIVIFHEVAVFLAFAGYMLTGPILWARMRLFPRTPAPAPVATRPTDADGGNSLF